MTKIAVSKLSVIVTTVIYIIILIATWFMTKEKQDYLMLISVEMTVFLLHSIVSLGNYIKYDEKEMIRHRLFIFTRRMPFADIKYIKTENRRSTSGGRLSSACFWVITLIEGKEINININSYSYLDIKQFKTDL